MVALSLRDKDSETKVEHNTTEGAIETIINYPFSDAKTLLIKEEETSKCILTIELETLEFKENTASYVNEQFEAYFELS